MVQFCIRYGKGLTICLLNRTCINKRLQMVQYALYLYLEEEDRISQICSYCAARVNPSTFTHWGRVTHICARKLTTIGSDNGLSRGRHQAIIWTNAGLLLIGPWRTNFHEILIDIHTFENVVWEMATILFRPQCVKYLTLMVMESGYWVSIMAADALTTCIVKSLNMVSNIWERGILHKKWLEPPVPSLFLKHWIGNKS